MSKIIPCVILFFLLGGALDAQSSLVSDNRQKKSVEVQPANIKSVQEKIRLYLGPNEENNRVTAREVQQRIQSVAKLLELQNIKRKHPRKVIQLIRNEIETKYLQQYKALSDFGSLFREFTYNDLTAAALISLLLDELKIDHFFYLEQQQPRIDLLDGTPLKIEFWGQNRPSASNQKQEQVLLVDLVNALGLPPESDYRQRILKFNQPSASKRMLSPATLSSMPILSASTGFLPPAPVSGRFECVG